MRIAIVFRHGDEPVSCAIRGDDPRAAAFAWQWVDSLKASPDEKTRAMMDFLARMDALAATGAP